MAGYGATTMRLGTVQSVTPLLVRLDGDSADTPCEVSLVHRSELQVGSYVSVTLRPLRYGSMQAVLDGKVNGTPAFNPGAISPPVTANNSGSFSTANTNYTYQAAVCSSTSFVGPKSGRVLVLSGGLARSTTAGQPSGFSWEILLYGTSTVFMTHNPATNAALNYNTQYANVFRSRLVEGLQEGTWYTCRQLALVSAGGGLLAWSSLDVIPYPVYN